MILRLERRSQRSDADGVSVACTGDRRHARARRHHVLGPGIRSRRSALHLLYRAVDQRLVDRGGHRQGRAAHLDRRRPRRLLHRQCLEHRCGGPAYRRRPARRLYPDLFSRLAVAAGPGPHARTRHRRRCALRRDPGVPEEPLLRQRDPDQPDARLRRAVVAGLAGARALARPRRLQLPSVHTIRGLGAARTASGRGDGCISAPSLPSPRPSSSPS